MVIKNQEFKRKGNRGNRNFIRVYKHTGLMAGMPQHMPRNSLCPKPYWNHNYRDAFAVSYKNSSSAMDNSSFAFACNICPLPDKKMHFKKSYNFKYRAYSCRNTIQKRSAICSIFLDYWRLNSCCSDSPFC